MQGYFALQVDMLTLSGCKLSMRNQKRGARMQKKNMQFLRSKGTCQNLHCFRGAVKRNPGTLEHLTLHVLDKIDSTDNWSPLHDDMKTDPNFTTWFLTVRIDHVKMCTCSDQRVTEWGKLQSVIPTRRQLKIVCRYLFNTLASGRGFFKSPVLFLKRTARLIETSVTRDDTQRVSKRQHY